MKDWVAEWPVGSIGRFGGRIKEHVKVVGVEWERGFPTLKLLATTGHTYYCKYGFRRDLEKLCSEKNPCCDRRNEYVVPPQCL
jgi:hypothetical protein